MAMAPLPRLGDHLHGHGALTAAARLVTQDAEGALLVRHCSRRASGRGGSEGHVRIFRPTTLQVLRAHPCHETTAALACSHGCADEVKAVGEEAGESAAQEEKRRRARAPDVLPARHDPGAASSEDSGAEAMSLRQNCL